MRHDGPPYTGVGLHPRAASYVSMSLCQGIRSVSRESLERAETSLERAETSLCQGIRSLSTPTFYSWQESVCPRISI
eukprot:scaffold208885_cov23-Prasinocladus_malaysianus.AAC.1